MPKFFVKKEQINDKKIVIDGDDANHISNVLRARINDEIIIGDGEGEDYICRISQISKKQIEADIIEKRKNENEIDVKITLYQGIAKGERMDMAIQKCVEIGVYKIVPVSTEFTVVRLDGKESRKVERWNKISEAAAKQCGRGIIPRVENVMNFKEAVKEALKDDNYFIPYEKEKECSLKGFIKNIKGKSVSIFIGPEGGFSDDEIKLARESGITSVTLGKRILRTETAGLVTSAILLYELEDRE